jgi:hypothetical protein
MIASNVQRERLLNRRLDEVVQFEHGGFTYLAGIGRFDEADPPIAEQLVSPGAHRQRRWRERQAALRNATQALRVPSPSGGQDEAEDGGGDDLSQIGQGRGGAP